jgi:hypothetical protein
MIMQGNVAFRENIRIMKIVEKAEILLISLERLKLRLMMELQLDIIKFHKWVADKAIGLEMTKESIKWPCLFEDT